jgi:O-acetyl-ADP-ribose deacetylase (regulator of RNase III)/uncharacterized protein (DUF3820 family)
MLTNLDHVYCFFGNKVQCAMKTQYERTKKKIYNNSNVFDPFTRRSKKEKERRRSMLYVVSGNLLSSDATYIVHQTNCRTKGARGLAQDMFRAFPYAAYKHFKKRTPGEIHVCGNGKSERFVINLYGQNKEGSPTFYETRKQRLQWFQGCLLKIEKLIKPNETLAFPENIGCGLAKGNWSDYKTCLENFAKNCNEKEVKVYLYCLPTETKSSCQQKVLFEMNKDQTSQPQKNSPKNQKLLVCGDRKYTNRSRMEEILSRKEFEDFNTLIHGDCIGADQMAAQVISKLYPNWKIQSFPANWVKYGIKAGPIRNLTMIEEKPDLVLAFHDHMEKSKGTKSMIQIALKNKTKVIHVTQTNDMQLEDLSKEIFVDKKVNKRGTKRKQDVGDTSKYVLPFGKHKGKCIYHQSVPDSYLQWMIDQNKKDPNSFSNWTELCHTVLNERNNYTPQFGGTSTPH